MEKGPQKKILNSKHPIAAPTMAEKSQKQKAAAKQASTPILGVGLRFRGLGVSAFGSLGV